MSRPPASDPRLEADLAEATSRIGGLDRDLSPQLLAASQVLYARFHPAEPYAGVKLTRDHSYGPDGRHRLDVFAPAERAENRPVLLYVHGGGFQRGDKKTEGLPYFDNIASWAAQQGWLGVTMTYRLAPEHLWPAGRDDVARAVAWLRAHAARHGGDPQRIYVMGHSAGAVHAADFLGTGATDGVAGALLFSGLYDFSSVRQRSGLTLYFGPDLDQRSPMEALLKSKVPIFIGVAEFDSWDFQYQALVLAKALFERDGRLPPLFYAAGQNHYTEMHQIGLSPAVALHAEISRFLVDQP